MACLIVRLPVPTSPSPPSLAASPLCSYVIMGDGCNMEGISSEAASLAGHWGLGKLIALYDDNRISIDGHTDISFTEDVCARYEAMGWHVQHVADGNHDLEGLRAALQKAKVRACGRAARAVVGQRLWPRWARCVHCRLSLSWHVPAGAVGLHAMRACTAHVLHGAGAGLPLPIMCAAVSLAACRTSPTSPL